MLDGPAPVLEVSDLRTVFATRDGAIHAVNGVSFSIGPGELLGVVGESGSGKSVTMMSLMGLLPSPPARVVGGSILYQGREVRDMSARELRQLRGGGIGFVFQDPMTSLNPVFTIGYQLMEPIRAHLGLGRSAARARAAELLALVGIPDAAARLDSYPHQFSGGMRQRVMIAMALSCDPNVLIADEPTTALDVTIQAQILEIVRDLRHKLGMGIIWITHDLGLVAGIADRVMVMYAGQIAEHGTVAEIFTNPQHPYTRALLGTVPSVCRRPGAAASHHRGSAADPAGRPHVVPVRPALRPRLQPLPDREPAAAAGRSRPRRRLLVGSGDGGAAECRLRLPRSCVSLI